MRRSRAGVLAAACCLILGAGCAGKTATTPVASVENVWIANAGDVIDELERDQLLSASGGDTLTAARRVLRDDSALYTILVAYTDFGGCNHMVAAVGAPPAGFAPVVRTLGTACAELERSAVLFTRATTKSAPPRGSRGTRRRCSVSRGRSFRPRVRARARPRRRVRG
jgi:hypothetical protein